MSSAEENTEMILPCVLVTSTDSEFKEEELIKRKFSGHSQSDLAG